MVDPLQGRARQSQVARLVSLCWDHYLLSVYFTYGFGDTQPPAGRLDIGNLKGNRLTQAQTRRSGSRRIR